MRPRAFILTGALSVVCRDPIYIEELRRRDLEVLVLTAARWRGLAQARAKDPAHPVSAITELAFIDGSVEAEGSFLPGVIEHARRWRQHYDMVGIYAVGETLVEPTGVVADFLGLPFPGLRAARACRSKYLQRCYLPDSSPGCVVLAPGRRDGAELTCESVPLPAVVKPATRHSSLGVRAVHGREELLEQLGTYHADETVLVEQRIVGQEYSVESLVQDGTPVFASVTRKETNEVDSRCFVEMAHTVPADPGSATDAVLRDNERMLQGLRVENGITHGEWRVGEDGRAYLMEVAARTPGDGIMALYRLATGERMEAEVLRIALGEPASYPAPTRYARQVYVEHRPGRLHDVTVDWPEIEPQWVADGVPWPDIPPGRADDPPTLRAVLVTKARGAELGPLESSNDRAITFFVDAPSSAGLDEVEVRVRGAITIETHGS